VKDAAPLRVSENIEGNAADLVRVVKEFGFGFEGIVAKRKDSCYESGKRSGAWCKYKVNQGQEFVIGGYTVGNLFDALIVGYYEDAKLHYVAKVRNGFVPQLRRDVAKKFKGLETDVCPFANLPEKKRTRVDAGRSSETSRFAGLREDKNAREVVREG
jgi:bifunctional non-homologous end joining protein LigD